MKLYLANCTDQVQIVNVRPPENKKKVFTQTIDIARQVIFAAQEIDAAAITFVTEFLAIYGARSCADFEHAREEGMTIPLMWNTDQPVPHEMHMRVIKWNRGVLFGRGKKLREEAAIATSVGMRNMAPNAADTLWMSVQEDKPGTMPDSDTLNEGVRMDVTAPPFA
jgi:hypothetical protein